MSAGGDIRKRRTGVPVLVAGALALAAASFAVPSPAGAGIPFPEDRILQSLKEAGVRDGVVHRAFAALRRNAERVRKPRFLTLIDLGLHSSKPRMFLVDLRTGRHEALLVAHGVGSDPDHDGYADRFSNVEGSRMSSVGAYLTRNLYRGKHGLSLRLEGLDPTNDRALERAIVIHGADYVAPGRRVMGRSWGCPAIERRHVKRVMPQLAGGSFIYIAR